MATIHQFLRARLLSEVDEQRMPAPCELADSETSESFTLLRRNRKVIGVMRYGRMGSLGKLNYDRVDCMIRRLRAYLCDRNAEHLVDVANLAELEFVEGDHLGVIASDDGEHTKVSV